MKRIITQIRKTNDCPPGTIVFLPVSDDDREAAGTFQLNQIVRQDTFGVKKLRSYRQLCAYKGSCRFVAHSSDNDNLNTPEKVDELTKIKCGFIHSTIVLPNGSVHYITDSLSYANCDSPRATKFIGQALEDHASIFGLGVDQYLHDLNNLGQGYAG